jgi:hypothetical protein
LESIAYFSNGAKELRLFYVALRKPKDLEFSPTYEAKNIPKDTWFLSIQDKQIDLSYIVYNIKQKRKRDANL